MLDELALCSSVHPKGALASEVLPDGAHQRMFMDKASFKWAQSCLNRKGPFPNCWKHSIVVNLKNIPTPSSLLHHLHSWPKAVRTLMFSRHPPNLHPSHQRTLRHHFTEHVYPLLESSGGALYATPSNTGLWTWRFKACVQVLGYRNTFHESPAAQIWCSL